MDIHENIKTVRTVINQKNPDDLKEPLFTLTDYVYENISKLYQYENRQLKQQISDCLLLGGNQILTLSPHYRAYYFLAVSHFLNDDIKGLSQNMTVFLDEDKKAGGQSLTSDECTSYILFFHDNLINKEQQTSFISAMTKVLDRNYPETAATYYIKSCDPSLDNEQSLQYLSQTIAIDKDFLSALYDIASIYQDNKNWKNAILYYNRCTALDVLNVQDIYFRLGLCYGHIKDYDNEIASYKKCLDIDPKYPFAVNNLGYAYEKSKDYEQALSCYQQSLKSSKDGVLPYRNTFRLLKKLKRYDDAIEFWGANKKRFPTSFQSDVDKIRDMKNKPVPQQVIQDDINDELESETISEPLIKTKSSKKINNSFLAESRLEDEIEDCINRGLGYFNLPLKMYDNNDGYGRQYITPVGRIDILAVNTSNNDLYVIELKRGLGDDDVVGQVSRYMGWVKKNLASSSQNVYGIICVALSSDKLKYAAEANPNISIYNYSIQITPV